MKESQLHSFYDESKGMLLHFLEGQKLIHDLFIIHEGAGAGPKVLRDLVLSINPIISFLKPGEGLGLYIDNEKPYFRFKIEANVSGQMRSLLIHDDLPEFPEKLQGPCRLTKTFSYGKAPYTSILELNQVPSHELVNIILRDSYQVQGQVFISETSDQSVLILKLPPINVDKIEFTKSLSIDEYWQHIKPTLEKLFARGTTELSEIQQSIGELGGQYLRSKTVLFQCPCSKERMILGLLGLQKSGENIFEQNKESLEAKCDYCKKIYHITKSDITDSMGLKN